MIYLRPHHLFCIYHFVGYGYSETFVNNMKDIIRRLKNEQFIIVNRNDNICSSCPNLINELCKTFDKVNRFDQKTMELLKLDYQTPYSYIELIEKIKNIVNDEQIFNQVCLDCEWGNICHKK